MMSSVRCRGISLITFLCIVVVGTIIVQTFAKIIPVYRDDYYISESLKRLGENAQLSDLSVADIRSKLRIYFNMNDLDVAGSNKLKINEADGNIIVDIEYKEIVQLMGNIDLHFSFHHYLDTSKPSECCKPL